MKSNKECAEEVERGVRYLLEAACLHQKLPLDRAQRFAARRGAQPGDDVWQFLMSEAERMEYSLENDAIIERSKR
ncbi:hypothetical protein LCGC14_2659870 [marine sediment metagenome]|uniref:Uncharacterized protein n=1 Tax=marine sediment metagenome TaxID=412755 RepID=A0A0F9CJ54_9ZZZZ